MILSLLVPIAFAEPYTLDAALEAARTRSPDAAMIDARREQARGDAGAATAPLLPQVSVTGAYRHNDKEISFPNPFDPTATLTIQKLDVVNAGVSGSQVIFNGGLFARAIAARKADHAAEAAHDAAMLDLSLRTANTWLGARSAREVRAAMEEALSAAESHEKVAQAGLAAGTVTPLAADRAKLAVLDAKQKLADASRQERDLLGQLSVLVGGGPVEIVAGPIVATGETLNEATLIEHALAARPELAVAHAQLDAARAGKLTVAGDWAPSVTAVGAYSYTNSPMFTDDPASWYVGVNATLPVFDGGLRFAEARRVNAAVMVAQANVDKLEASTREDVLAAVRAENDAEAALELARAQEETALHARMIAESSFSAGGSTAVDVEDAQAALLGARMGRVRAEAQWLAARWTRARLCGEGIE